MSIIPLYSIMGIDVATAAFAILPLFFVAIPQPERSTSGAEQPPSLWQDVREGMRYIWSWPGLLIILVMASVINFLLTPAFVLAPILVTQYFGGEAMELGWIESAFGVGVVLGGLILSVWGGFRRRILTTLMGLIGIGIGVAIIGTAPNSALYLALAGFFLSGLAIPIANGPLFICYYAGHRSA
jgi:DHA3 family macrolide efflux protein-like MFS transporter